MERRLRTLERAIPPVVTPEARALAERLAAEDGCYTADELIAEVQATLQAVGQPYTTERIVRYVSRRDGIPVEELYAALEQHSHE